MFFFCKQKTAYELRISDWSSDVCSSDLAHPRFRRGIARHADTALKGQHRGDVDDLARTARDHMLADRLAEEEERLQIGVHHRVPIGLGEVDRKIGRASCRERVCPYV